MIIKILGTGCPKCKLLEQTVKEEVAALGLDAQVEKVQNMQDILQYDILALPGLVIDEVLLVSGRIPERAEIRDILAHQ